MKLNPQEIARLVGGTLVGNGNASLSGAASLDSACPSDVSFLGNPKYRQQVAASKAGLILLPAAIEGLAAPQVVVSNPQLAFAKVLTVLSQEQPRPAPGIHSSAVVAKGANIAPSATVGPGCVIEEEASIGENTVLTAQCYVGRGSTLGANCLIYPQVTIRERVTVGSRVILHPGVVLGADGFGFSPSPAGIFKIPQIGTVIIDDDVEIGANTTVDRATTGATRIGRSTKIDNLVQIAHNVQIGANCVIAAQVGISGSTILEDGVTMGGQSGSAGHVKIGSGATVAARAGVTKTIEPKEVVSDFPARPHREALRLQAMLHRLPELYAAVLKTKKAKR